MAVLGDSVNVVGEVDMAVARRGHIKFEVLHEDMRVLIDDGYLQAVSVSEDGVACAEASMLVALMVKQFFSTRDEEESVVDEVSTDDKRLAMLCSICGRLMSGSTRLLPKKPLGTMTTGYCSHSCSLAVYPTHCVASALP